MKKFLLIVLILFILIVVIGGLFICTQKDKLAGYAIEKILDARKSEIVASLPASVKSDSARVILDGVLEKVKTGEIDKLELQLLATNFQQILADNKIDSTEAEKLLQTLQDIAE